MRKLLTAPLTITMLAMLWLTSGTFAQKTPEYETISTAQGLSQGMVFDMLQDKEGFIWAATTNGLNRYDGYNFTIYRNDAQDNNTIVGNYVTDITEDKNGDLWIATLDGLSKFDRKKESFTQYKHDYKTREPFRATW